MSSAVIQTPPDQLSDAISRNAAVIVWFRSGGIVRTMTSRFLGRQANGIWIAMPAGDAAAIKTLSAVKCDVAVAYKCGEISCRFAATVIAHERTATDEASMPADGLLLQRPEDRSGIHRRKDFRVSTRDSRLEGKLWRIADYVYFRDRPSASQRLAGRVVDLSVGGIGVIVETPPTPIDIHQRLRIELHYDGTELLLEGVVRHAAMRKHGACVRVGVQFKKLENDVVWRQSISTIGKIVGDIQRIGVRKSMEMEFL